MFSCSSFVFYDFEFRCVAFRFVDHVGNVLLIKTFQLNHRYPIASIHRYEVSVHKYIMPVGSIANLGERGMVKKSFRRELVMKISCQ